MLAAAKTSDVKPTLTCNMSLSKDEAMEIGSVSEWVSLGHHYTGWSHLRLPVINETAQKISVIGFKIIGSSTSYSKAVIHLPSDDLIPVEDDLFLSSEDHQDYLLPAWLIQKVRKSGYSLSIPQPPF